jgi:hypothetical protein
MSASSSSDVHVLAFTQMVGMVCSDVWEKRIAAVFRVT